MIQEEKNYFCDYLYLLNLLSFNNEKLIKTIIYFLLIQVKIKLLIELFDVVLVNVLKI